MRREVWTLTKAFTFEAAHHLPAHDGKCRRVHGHSWAVQLEVFGHTLFENGPKADMVIDYGDITAAFEPLWETCLDHHDLNATTKLPNPTSEALARWIYDNMIAHLPNLVSVTVRETCTSECRYARG